MRLSQILYDIMGSHEFSFYYGLTISEQKYVNTNTRHAIWNILLSQLIKKTKQKNGSIFLVFNLGGMLCFLLFESKGNMKSYISYINNINNVTR